MSLKIYLIAIGTVSLSAFIVWLFILFNIDPVLATRFELALFYISLFLFLFGLLALLLFYLRLIKSKNEFYYGNLLTSLRQSGLMSLFLTLTLFLRSLRIIRPAEIVLLFAAFFMFEMYFLAKK